jgi:signal transduction histidine kinase
MTDRPSSKASDDSSPKPTHVQKISLPDELLHQLGTPLTIISGHTQLLQRRTKHLADDDVAVLDRSLRAIDGAVQRMVTVLMEGYTQDNN